MHRNLLNAGVPLTFIIIELLFTKNVYQVYIITQYTHTYIYIFQNNIFMTLHYERIDKLNIFLFKIKYFICVFFLIRTVVKYEWILLEINVFFRMYFN